MGSKNQPGKFDCYANALPDEPMFILLARDPHAPALVDEWAAGRMRDIVLGLRPKSDLPMVDEAQRCAEQMREWRAANDGKWRPERNKPMAEKDIVEELHTQAGEAGVGGFYRTEELLHRAADLITRLQARVPEGYRLVPVEPTDEMLDAFWRAMFNEPPGDNGPVLIGAGYDAMLSASPEPPATAGWTLVPNELVVAAQDFVAKVDRGEARSQRSYGAFKSALDRLSATPAHTGEASEPLFCQGCGLGERERSSCEEPECGPWRTQAVLDEIAARRPSEGGA